MKVWKVSWFLPYTSIRTETCERYFFSEELAKKFWEQLYKATLTIGADPVLIDLKVTECNVELE